MDFWRLLLLWFLCWCLCCCRQRWWDLRSSWVLFFLLFLTFFDGDLLFWICFILRAFFRVDCRCWWGCRLILVVCWVLVWWCDLFFCWGFRSRSICCWFRILFLDFRACIRSWWCCWDRAGTVSAILITTIRGPVFLNPFLALFVGFIRCFCAATVLPFFTLCSLLIWSVDGASLIDRGECSGFFWKGRADCSLWRRLRFSDTKNWFMIQSWWFQGGCEWWVVCGRSVWTLRWVSWAVCWKIGFDVVL